MRLLLAFSKKSQPTSDFPLQVNYQASWNEDTSTHCHTSYHASPEHESSMMCRQWWKFSSVERENRLQRRVRRPNQRTARNRDASFACRRFEYTDPNAVQRLENLTSMLPHRRLCYREDLTDVAVWATCLRRPPTTTRICWYTGSIYSASNTLIDNKCCRTSTKEALSVSMPRYSAL
jgi:hypothetical protein